MKWLILVVLLVACNPVPVLPLPKHEVVALGPQDALERLNFTLDRELVREHINSNFSSLGVGLEDLEIGTPIRIPSQNAPDLEALRNQAQVLHGLSEKEAEYIATNALITYGDKYAIPINNYPGGLMVLYAPVHAWTDSYRLHDLQAAFYPGKELSQLQASVVSMEQKPGHFVLERLPNGMYAPKVVTNAQD